MKRHDLKWAANVLASAGAFSQDRAPAFAEMFRMIWDEAIASTQPTTCVEPTCLTEVEAPGVRCRHCVAKVVSGATAS